MLFGLLALPNWSSTSWNLLLHHTSKWGDISEVAKIKQILSYRLPLLFFAFPTYITLILFVFGFNLHTVRRIFKQNKIVTLFFISSLLFTTPNLISGGYHAEYFVTILFMMFPLLSILILEIFPEQKMIPRILVQTLILSTFLLGFARGGWVYIDVSGGSLPIEEVQDLASVVSKYSDIDDSIFALQGLWIPLESNRKTLPGMAMAQFSYYEGSRIEASQYNLINDVMIADSIQNKIPSLVILTNSDWELMENSPNFEKIQGVVHENYSLLISRDYFGQQEDLVEIYSRIDD